MGPSQFGIGFLAYPSQKGESERIYVLLYIVYHDHREKGSLGGIQVAPAYQHFPVSGTRYSVFKELTHPYRLLIRAYLYYRIFIKICFGVKYSFLNSGIFWGFF